MPAGLAIHRLSARIPVRAQPVAARLALQALGADLEDAMPRGLPPQALLWLRRISLEVPAAALARPATAAWRADWIAAGRDRMDTALAHAARPALGPVADDAEAVLFADAAEMLACLALASRAGQLDRWWWRGLLGRHWPQWQAAWVARPEAHGAAQRLLLRAGQRRVVAFEPEAQGDIAGSPIETTAVETVVKPDARDVALDHSEEAGSSGRVVDSHPSTQSRETAMPPKNEHSVERPTPALGEARAVEVAGVVPQASARSESLVADEPVRRPARAAHRQASVIALREPPQPANPPFPVAQIQSEASPAQAAARAMPRRAEVRQPLVKTVPGAEAAKPIEFAGEPEEIHLQAEADHADTSVVASPPAAPVGPVETFLIAPEPTHPRKASAAASAAPQDAAQPLVEATPWPWPQALASRQAPLLFIVNALLEDGLYPDFTRPRDPGLPVSLWALLLALSQAWRLPSEDGLQAALAERAGDWQAADHLPAAPGAAAGPWIDWLPAYARSLRRRLCRRLGLRAADWVRALTLEQPARLWLSEAEWVAEFELTSHDVAWRLAGLDRDPGWLPSVDCTLSFRFMC